MTTHPEEERALKFAELRAERDRLAAQVEDWREVLTRARLDLRVIPGWEKQHPLVKVVKHRIEHGLARYPVTGAPEAEARSTMRDIARDGTLHSAEPAAAPEAEEGIGVWNGERVRMESYAVAGDGRPVVRLTPITAPEAEEDERP